MYRNTQFNDQIVNPMAKTVNPMTKTVNPMAKTVNQMAKTVNPMTKTVNPIIKHPTGVYFMFFIFSWENVM